MARSRFFFPGDHVCSPLLLKKAVLFEDSADNSADLQECVVGNRLPEIGGATPGSLIAVVRRIRRCHDENRNVAVFLAGSNSPEHLEAIHLGKIEIEEENVRARRIGVLLGIGNEVDGALAVGRGVNLDRQILRPNGLPHQQGVGQIVFSQQQIQRARMLLRAGGLGR